MNDSGHINSQWQSEFRKRMDRFAIDKPGGLMPVSIKVRVESGCFHREHSPGAFKLIDDYLANSDLSDLRYQIHEHESGPEILVYLAVATAGLSLAKSLVELVTAIVKARSEGIKRGDRPSDPLVLIVRGHYSDGEYFEEKILRIQSQQRITLKQIEDALLKRTKLDPKNRGKN